MANNNQDLLPMEQILKQLLALCDDNQSGDLSLFTEEKHVAVISLNEGDIVGLRYRISRGSDALKLIKGINRAKARFQSGATKNNQTDRDMIPSTADILNVLGAELQHGDVGGITGKVHKKVLVVEDSATQRKIICRMLTQNGYSTVEAVDGYQAIAQVGKTKPDLILLDIVMPGIDGYKVMSAIKEKPGMGDVPIIMLTSRDSLIDKMRGKVSGTDEYLTKPFKSEKLISMVNKYLQNNAVGALRSAYS